MGMNSAANNSSEISLLDGAVFARLGADRLSVGGITLLTVEVGRAGKTLATFEATLYRGRVGLRRTEGGAVPGVVETALREALEARPDVAEWR